MYNVLVLDDEILIRKSIITKLNKSSFSLGKVVEAGNSKQALETLNDTKFDILITDIRMGGPSGLDFIEELKKISPWTKSIIISGYEEFSYASRAISLGVVDYLLKPINTNELLVSVEKAINIIDEERSSNNTSVLLRVSDEAFKLAALYSKNSIHSAKDLSSYISIASKGSPYFVELRLFVEHPKDLIISLLYGAIKESTFTYGEDVSIYVDRLRQSGLVFAFKEKSLDNKLPQSLLDLIENIRNQFVSQGMYTFNFGISNYNKTPILSHERAIFSMKHRIIFEDREIINYDDCLSLSNNVMLSKEESLNFSYLLNTQSYNKISDFIDNLENKIRENYPTYDSLQKLYIYLRDCICTKFEYDIKSSDAIESLYFFNSYRKMFNYLKKIALDAITQANVSTNEGRMLLLVNNLKTFIDEHYAENIGLEIFADHNNVNTCTLSNQFHKIANITFQDYLNEVRIKNAKKLLDENKYKIGVIASMCGFSSSHYFSKTFKKVTSLTPSEYKESKLNTLSD